MNDEQNSDPNSGFDPNPPSGSTPPPPPPIDRAKLERKLKLKFNVEPDELKVLYPTDESLKEFYDSVVRKIKTVKDDGADDDGAEPKDDGYKLSRKERIAHKDYQLDAKRAEREQQTQEDKQAEAAFNAVGANVPPDQQVSYADALAAMRDLGLSPKKNKKGKN